MEETKKQYVEKRIKKYRDHCEQNGKAVNEDLLKVLINQWEFDYEMTHHSVK